MGELSPTLVTVAEPYLHPDSGPQGVPGQLDPNLAASQLPQATGNVVAGDVLEGEVGNVADTPYTGQEAIMPPAAQPEMPKFGAFKPVPTGMEGPRPRVERTGDLAYRIGPGVARLAIGATFERPGNEVAIPAAPTPEAENPHDQLRQTFMSRLRVLANGASLEGLGYETADLHALEYAVKDLAHRRYYDSNDTAPMSVGALQQKRASSDRFEQLGITDLSDEAVAQRAVDEEQYLELNRRLYAEATQTYSDEELRAAGYDWASADELFAVVAAAKRSGKQPLPNLQQKRAQQSQVYAQQGYPTYEDYQRAHGAIEQMHQRLIAGIQDEQGRRGDTGAAWMAAQQAAEAAAQQARFAAGAGAV